ncbi:glycosyltransferase family 4 protein (plasmid) [Salipiger sp. H15]|uniref:Glycosyltransferase family 4 protein n=1 Tax=Alloyangia sp. H15 TaxID=3029062 RepID=A0AAU8AQB3_9RHOB
MPVTAISSPPLRVRHYLPGGRENGGGIGRLVGYILDAQQGGDQHSVIDTRGPRWSPLPSGYMLSKAVLSLMRDQAMARDTVHHIHVAGRGSTARKLVLTAAARAVGARHVLHLHDYDYRADFLSRPPQQQAAVRQMFYGADRVIVLGRRDRDTLSDLLDLDPARISVLYNCVPDPGPRCAAGRADAPLHLIFLGQLGPRKGTPDLLDALATPGMASRDWTATLAGDGPVEAFRARAAELGLAARVAMPGWLSEPDVRRLCAAADILVLPSHAEGFAMAVLEGMAQGLAVVTTAVGAHDEILAHGQSCIFVPVGDPAALAGALARLVDDAPERARLGAAARRLFLERLEIGGYVRDLAALHRGLLPAKSLKTGAA